MIESMNTIARWWWEWMVAVGWQMAVLVGIIGGIDMVIRRWAWPQLRYALWSLVLLKLLLPPTLSLPSGLVQGVPPAVQKAVARLTPEKPAAPMAAFRFQIADSPPMGHLQSGSLLPHAGASRLVSRSVGTNPQSAIHHPPLNWRVYVMSVWLLGVTALGTFLAVRLHALSRGCAETSEAPPAPESFYNRMRQCASRVGLRRLPRVVSTARLSHPAVFGALRPILLMPVGYLSRLSRTDTEHVLLHEFCHIKRGDLFVHGFTLCLQVVYWFNPLLWLVRRRLHHLRELCCDASVANLLRADTPAYRQTLLETARRFLATHGAPGLGLLGLFEDSNCLLMRLRWLEKPTWRYRKMKNLIVIVMAGLVAACFLPMAQAQPATAVHESATVPHISDEQMTPEMRDLQAQMQALQGQMQQLARRMGELRGQTATLRHEVADARPFRSYTVKEGDTLAGIAASIPGEDNVTVEELIARIREVNELTTDSLQAGQRLWLPVRPARVTTPTPATVPHTPRDPNLSGPPLRPHAVMRAPARAADTGLFRRYTVLEGDTLAGVAGKIAGSDESAMENVIARIREANGLTTDSLQVGRKLWVPFGTPAPRVPPVPVAPQPPAHVEDLRATVELEPQYRVAPLQPDTLVRVTNEIGSVKINTSADRDCTVKAIVKGKADTEQQATAVAKQVQIQVTPEKGTLQIGALLPEMAEHTGVEISFEITVPRQTRVEVVQKVGAVKVSGLANSVSASVEAGSITGRYLTGDVEMLTRAGNIDISVPADASARITAQAKIGRVKSELPLEVTGASTVPHDAAQSALGSSAAGTLRAGRHKINLRAEVGSIKITAAGSTLSEDPQLEF